MFLKWKVKLLCKSKGRLYIANLLKVVFDYLVISRVRILDNKGALQKCKFHEIYDRKNCHITD